MNAEIPSFPGSVPQESAPVMPPYSFAIAFSRGVELFKAHWAQLMLATLLVVGVSLVLGVINAVLEAILPLLAAVVNILLAIFVSYPVTTGVVLYCVRLARGDPGATGPAVMLVMQQRYLRCVGACVVLALLMLAISLPFIGLVVAGAVGGFYSSQSSSGTIPWWIVPAILLAISMLVVIYYLACRIAFLPLIAIDPACGDVRIGEALSASWRLTRGHGWSLLGLFVVLSMVMIASVFLLCVGVLLVGYPFGLATIGVASAMILQPLCRPQMCAECGSMMASSRICPNCGSWRTA